MKKGFTLVEILAVIAVLGLVIAISIPKVVSTIKDSNKKAFRIDAQLVLKTIDLKLAQGLEYDITTLDVETIKSVFGINNKNFKTLSVTIENGIPYISIEGKNEWEGFLAFGSEDDVVVTEEDYVDTVAPVISLIGASQVYLEAGAMYYEVGATAIDNHDGDITNKITMQGNVVNTAVPGTYVLNYAVSDYIGNVSSVTRTVTVLANAAPTVAFGMNGNTTYAKSRSTSVTVSDNVAVVAGSLEYQWTTSTTAPTEASFTTTFTNGGTINSPAGVNGGYYLWILAKDTVGNTMIEKSNVFNLDNTAPVLTLNGNSSISAYQYVSFTDSGVVATDNVDSTISSKVTVVNNVNINTPGSYSVTYNVTDASGNVGVAAVRTVNINPHPSCKSIKTYVSSSTSGTYTIDPNGGSYSDKFNVYCDMETDGGGWTLVWSNLKNYTSRPVTSMTRANAIGSGVWYNGTLSANKESFEVYMGLGMWNTILSNTSGSLRYEWRYDFGVAKTQEAKFTLAPFSASNNYAINLTNYVQLVGSTTAGLWSYTNGQSFSTYDGDYDSYSGNCSSFYSNTPWWYRDCWDGSINGGGQNSGHGYYNGAYWSGSTQTWGTTSGAGAGNGWLWLK